ncbi:MAG: GTPase Era [Oscillospiraceae bacterium]|nr:GTPase Era [Oscillospiraceae bacterium]
MTTKTAFVAIVGCPNVGKSSILNRLIGQKVAIVSEKPQTTRTKITGIVTKGDLQMVFTDTPGFHRPRNKLGERMAKAVSESVAGVDACLLVVEPEGELRDKERELLDMFRRREMPVVLAINKIDKIKNREALMSRIAFLSGLYDFEAVAPVSAADGSNLDALWDELAKLAQPSVHFFPDDALTDQPERVIAAEIIREKLLRFLDQEIPHGIAVSVEKMRERDDGSGLMDIEATVYCERESHKGIIIGKGGGTLKRISTRAREDMEKFFCCKINLRCFVKVKEDWRNREGLIGQFIMEN